MLKIPQTSKTKEQHMTQDNEFQPAVIYCRVSSKKQTTSGSGLDSQEHRCRAHAEERGYVVEAVFPDDISGGGDFMKRPGMVALLSYLDAQPDKNFVVIFDDLKRYARDTEFHLKLKREMSARNARRECLNFQFEDSPEGKFVETIFAAQGELERDQNSRQVFQKMKARVEQGFWVFQSPAGYRYEKSKHGGKELVRDEPVASIIQEALEGFASGRFTSQSEVARFLENQPAYASHIPKGGMRTWRVTKMLTNPLYSGCLEVSKWDVDLRKGKHKGLISFETFQKNQNLLNEGARAPAKKNINKDFPLRGFVLCGDCEKPLKSCWSQGKYKKYPYYLCQTKTCESYGKSIRRENIEGEFETILHAMTPTKSLFQCAKAMFQDMWNAQLAQTENVVTAFKKQVKRLDKQIEQLLDRIVETDNKTVVKAYEKRITGLEKERILASEKAAKSSKPKHKFEDVLELSMGFLANPQKLWDSEHLISKRTVLKLAFADRLVYDRNKGYRTPKISMPFKVLRDISDNNIEMVPLGRIELPASPLPRVRSTTELQRLIFDYLYGRAAF